MIRLMERQENLTRTSDAKGKKYASDKQVDKAWWHKKDILKGRRHSYNHHRQPNDNLPQGKLAWREKKGMPPKSQITYARPATVIDFGSGIRDGAGQNGYVLDAIPAPIRRI